MAFEKSEGSASGSKTGTRKPRAPQSIAPSVTIGTPNRPASPGIVGFAGLPQQQSRPQARPNSSGQYSAPSRPQVQRPSAPAPAQSGPVQRPGFQRPQTNSNGPAERPRNQGKPTRPNRPRGGFDAEKGKGGRPEAPPKENPGAVQGPGTPAAPSIDDYLMGDTAYQSGLAELMKQLQDFQTGAQGEQNNVNSAFQTALQRMSGERTNALKSLEEDFAARGLLNSGLYADAISDYDTQYNQQVGDLSSDNQGSIQAILAALGQNQSVNQTNQQALREQAIAQRAQKYGLM